LLRGGPGGFADLRSLGIPEGHHEDAALLSASDAELLRPGAADLAHMQHLGSGRLHHFVDLLQERPELRGKVLTGGIEPHRLWAFAVDPGIA
jgi:hypothetical protein